MPRSYRPEDALAGFASPTAEPRTPAVETGDEARFRTVFENAPIGMGLTGRDGRWLQVNGALCRLLGYDEHELREQTYQAVTHPEDLPFDAAQFRRLWAGEIASYALEKRYVHKDGHSVWALLTRSIVRDASGEPLFAISQILDISETKRVQDETAFIVEAGQVLSSSLDPEEVLRVLARLTVPRLADWCIVDLTAEPHGMRTVEIVAATARKEELLRALRTRYPLTSGPLPPPLERALRTGKAMMLPVVEPELLARTARDEEHLRILRELATVSSMVVPLVSRGRVMGTISLATSESGRRLDARSLRVAEELASSAALAIDNAVLYQRSQKATKARDDLVGFIAHDLRNPVAAAALWAERLRDPELTGAERRKAIDSIIEATSAMSALVSDLVDTSMIEAGRLRVQCESVRPTALLRSAAELFEPSVRAKGLTLRVEADELPHVAADSLRIRQVLSNLIANATQVTAPGGTITVSGRLVGDRVVIAVSDTGAGIASDEMPHLFDRFWQGARARRGGAGLGLAIAKGIVEAHGGEIWAESDPGHGATFSFSLVVWRGESAQRPTSVADTLASTTAASPSASVVRVLVVDDQPVTRIGVAELLGRQSGLSVVGQAASGEEALETARTMKPDVIVMDLVMPGIGGIEATRRLIAMDPNARVLALTGGPSEEALGAALEAGVRGFLLKNASAETLAAAVRSVARGEVLLDPGFASMLQERARRPLATPEDPLAVLSDRERKVLALAAQGYSAAEAAKRLFLSPKTVETYRSRAMRKLGLGSRAELVAFAVRTRLLSA